MVTANAHVKLLDFGIAKATENQREQTRTGMLKGKISYMSPEQCRQDKLDRRSDIFAMGIVAWEMLAGRKLFASKSELQTMQAIVQGNIADLRQFRTDVPAPIIHAIERALAVDPDSRYETALEMRRALSEAAHASGIKVDRDRSALLVKTLLGEVLEQRRESVGAAIERTMASNSFAMALDYSQPSVTMGVQNTSTRIRNNGMLIVSTFLIGMTAVMFTAFIAAYFAGLLSTGDVDRTNYTVSGPPIKMAIAAPGNENVIKEDYEPIRIYLERSLARPRSDAILRKLCARCRPSRRWKRRVCILTAQ